MRIVMMGTGRFAEPTFEAMLNSSHEVVGLVTNPDRPSGRDREMVRGMKKVAVERKIPVFQPESINTPAGVNALRSFQPDLLVVAAYGQILSHEVLQTAPSGGINVHASLLPRYRGAAPIAWAIYHGETKTGVTIIRMSVNLDAGDMIAQEVIDIDPEETTGELENRLALLGAALALRVVDKLSRGPVEGSKQDKTLVTKAPKLTKEHGVVDWTRSASQIHNQVRAMQPWPTAFTFLHQEHQKPLRILLQKVRPLEEKSPSELPPGWPIFSTPETSIKAESTLRVVAGQESVVEVATVQPAGKRSMSASDFLRGRKLRKGDFFGPEA